MVKYGHKVLFLTPCTAYWFQIANGVFYAEKVGPAHTLVLKSLDIKVPCFAFI